MVLPILLGYILEPELGLLKSMDATRLPKISGPVILGRGGAISFLRELIVEDRWAQTRLQHFDEL